MRLLLVAATLRSSLFKSILNESARGLNFKLKTVPKLESLTTKFKIAPLSLLLKIFASHHPFAIPLIPPRLSTGVLKTPLTLEPPAAKLRIILPEMLEQSPVQEHPLVISILPLKSTLAFSDLSI